jgi:hypothetical protein
MIEKSHLEFLAQQLNARRNTVADARQKLNGRQIGADRAPIGNAQIKHVRQTVLFDMCRFMLEDNSSAASFETSLAKKFLARPPFRRWLEQASCLEIYNRIYIKDARISALFSRLDAFVESTARDVVGHISKSAGVRPIVFKGSEIVPEYAPHPIGSSRDLDLVVLHPHFQRACEALKEQNWVQGTYEGDLGLVPYAPEIISRAEEGHYETPPFRKIFELALSDAERACMAEFTNGTFFRVVEVGPETVKFVFPVDMHWGYLTNLPADVFQLKESIFPFAVTLDDSDHLYLMLLRNYYEAVKAVGKLKNLIVSLLLMERGRVDWARVHYRATADNREMAIAANIALLEKISPHLAQTADPQGQFIRHRPDDAGMALFFNSMIGLKESQ